tara:strand:+ start:580 stop:2628 length:2049 start_codon:yes stop_codon:yes gene_type:complete
MASTGVTDTSIPTIAPQAGQTYADPAMEMATRNILASYFGSGQPGDLGLMGQPIPIPIQQVAGLSPLEVQARNAAQGLGGFGGQLAEAQDLFRQAGQGFDPRSAGLFADPRARALYEQSLGQYDPSTGERFVDQRARQGMEGAIGDIAEAGRGIPSIIGGAQTGMSDAERAIAQASGTATAGITGAAEGIAGQVGGAQTGAAEAAQRARSQTEMAGRDLRSAGQMGREAAQQGIAGLAGTGDQFDPAGIASFQDPFNQQVIEAQQAEIARLGEQQKRDARAQQIRAGAFGGSRGAVQEAEIGRNVLQQQAKTGAELRSQGFQQAAQQAQQAFEQAQGRRQQAAQLTGSLGQAGAGTSLQAAQQAGQLGLSAEQLAQRGALESGQLGLSGQQGIGSLLGQAGQMGMQAGRDIGSLAQQRGALGLQGAQAQAGLAGQRADIAQGMGQLGLQGQQLGANVFGQQMDRTAGAAAGLGGLTQNQFGTALQAFGAGTGAQRAAASGIAGLGQQGQQMLGTQISTLGQLGTQGRGIQQAGLDAQYKAGTQMADEPFMRLQRGQALLQGGAPFMPQYTSGFGMGQSQGQAQTRGSTLAQGLAAAGTVASFFPKSDIRLKENVIKIDDVQPGVGWYTWDWNDTAKAMGIDDPTEGVIAQELKAVDPSAVIMGDDGYYSVDYSKVNRSRSEV